MFYVGEKRTYSDQLIIEGIQKGGVEREKCIHYLFDTHQGFLHKVRKKQLPTVFVQFQFQMMAP